MINGMLWILRTGAPWRDLPERYGPWQSVYTRFRRWTANGLWQQTLAQVQAVADEAGQVDWAVHYLDGTVVRAHVAAAGAKKGRPTRRSAAPEAGSAPSSRCAAKVAASRWRWWSRRGNGMRARRSRR